MEMENKSMIGFKLLGIIKSKYRISLGEELNFSLVGEDKE